MRKLIKWIVALSMFTVVLLSCMSDDDCFTGDSIDQINTPTIKQQDHFLFLRTSGFQEKESFFELYEKKPTFDECARPDNPPISTAHVDSTGGQIKKLTIQGKELKLIYQPSGEKQKVDPKTIPIEIVRN